MSFNGSGVFTRIENWVTDRNGAIDITASRMDTDSNDFVTAFNLCLARDGQSTVTANIPWGGNKITFLGDGTGAGDATSGGNAQDNTATWAGTSMGSANAQTLSPTVPMASYTTGASLTFIAGFTNTGTTTLNVTGLGAKNIFLGNAALTAGAIQSGQTYTVTYDGTQFQITGPVTAAHTLLNIVNASAGTYTPTAGTNMVVVELMGGGGGGGGAAATGASTVSAGSGGGAGGYAVKTITSAFSGVTITIGGAGSGGVGAGAATAGGTTSFGAIFSVTGGGAGSTDLTGSGALLSTFMYPGHGGGDGGVGSSGDFNAAGGGGGNNLLNDNGANAQSGKGGDSFFGGGGAALDTFTANGNAGSVGGGGSGAVCQNSQAAHTGGAGSAGFVRIWEFS